MGIGIGLLILVFGVGLGWMLRAARSHSAVPDPNTVPAPDRAPDPGFLRKALEWCLAMAGASRVVLWRIDADAGLVRAQAVAGGAAPGAHVVHGSPITWIARERVSARLEPPPVWAASCRVIGVPVMEETPAHALTFELDDDVDVTPTQFDALGIHVGALLGVLHDHDILAAYQARTEYLLEALRSLPDASSADALEAFLIEAACRITGGSGAAVTVWHDDADASSLTALAARGRCSIVRGGAALRSLAIVAAKERYAPFPESAVAVPLITAGEVVGVLTAWSNTRIAETAVTALETIAPYAAVQLLHAHELGALRTLAEHDALTGLHNRRAFDRHLEAEQARFERYRRPFALIMLDIDHFKKINDTYGHEAGDEVLRGVGRRVAASLRDVDVAARYGGEEFALLLPETDTARAVEIAGRIRASIEKLELRWRGVAIPVTGSLGVAAIPERGRSPGDVMRDADQLLYRAKREGRNRVAY
ncbi:MAG: GGDEF domain-containing protein [Gemmatimonadota bacterium]